MQSRFGSDTMIPRLTTVFFLLTFFIIIAGFLYYENQKKQLSQNMVDELAAVADLKVSQIVAWRRERIGDASIVLHNRFILSDIERLFQNPRAADLHREIARWMDALHEAYDYKNVLLVDAAGTVLLSSDAAGKRIGPHAKGLIAEALNKHIILLSDLHKANVADYPHLDLVIPVTGGPGPESAPAGAVLLRVDSERFLYPLIQSWPGASTSAETLLARKEDGELLFLSKLRHLNSPALSLRIPLANKQELSAVLAQGGNGVIETRDYRDVPVLAVIRAVPQSPWLLISKIDREEITAPLRERALFLSAIIILMIAVAGMSTIAWWRQRNAEYARRRYEDELSRKALSERFDYLSKYANDIILLADQADRIIEANDRAVTAYGYTREELLRLSLRDIEVREPRQDPLPRMEQVREQNGFIFEAVHRRNDGTIFPVEVSSRLIDRGNASFVQSIIRDITERKKAESALINEKNRSEAIIAAIGDGISIQDRDFRILYQNEVHKNLIGEHTGKPCYEAYEHRTTVCEACPMAKSLSDGMVHTAERSMQHEDGLHYFEITSSPLRNEGGAVIAGIEAVRDITPRKRAEEALIESERRYRNLFDHSLTGFALHEIVTDAAGRPVDSVFLEANAAFEEMTGIRSGSIIGKRATEVLPGIVKTDFIATYGRVALTGQPVHFEHYAERLDKHFEIAAFSPAKGQFATIFSDISARKSAEHAQMESERRYRRLVESVTDYIYTVDVAEGHAVRTHHGPGCIAVTGYTSEEYAANPDLWFRMIHEEDRTMVLEQTSKLLSGTAVPPFEHRILHKNGSLLWVRNTPVPRYDRDGRLNAYDGLITDITQIKFLENQLRQAQKMEAVGQLAGGVAHDFNNILTAIIGYGNLLLMKMPPTDLSRTFVEQILSSAERAAHLTHSLLAFSRKQIIDLRPVNVNDIIRRVEKLLCRVIGEDIEFTTRLGSADMTVMADSVQIEQILMNLSTNARDAMPEGGSLVIDTGPVEIGEEFVRTHTYARPGPYVCICVTDTGIGMDETVRSRVFEPFFTTKEVGKGTGLGLAMVYGIVKQHNGYINVYSEPGQGTSFKIYLPLIAPASGRETGAAVDDMRHGTETVLLAEDDAAVRKLTGSVLLAFGYTVIEAVDGEDAVQKFNDHGDKIDLLILDIIMPKKNGKEAYQAIRKLKPGIKALFTSGYTADIVHKKGILETGLDFILKPSTPAAFLKKVREVLDKTNAE